MRFQLDPLSPSGLSVAPEPQKVTNRGGYAGSPDITRVLQPGTNVTFTGNGTQQSPYVVNASGGGSGSPGGSTTQLQYNNAGNFAGLANLTTDGTDITIGDGANINTGTTTGTKIGTATTQKIGIFNHAPVAQQANSTDIGTALSNFGLRAVGANWGASTSGTVNFSGIVKLTGSSTVGYVFTATDTAGTGTWQAITASTLTETATKTSAYNAVANDLVIADATSGGFTVTLPTAPANQTRIEVKKIDASTNLVTVTCGGSDVFTGTSGASSTTLNVSGYAVTLMYNSSTSKWTTLSNDFALSQADTRYLKASNNLSDVTASTARTNLGLGTLAIQSSVAISTDVTGLGTGVATFLATPTSANLAGALTDETGTGAAVFATNPTLGGATITDATNIVMSTTTGTQIGTGATQKMGFWGATPIVQTGNGVELFTGLSNAGIRTAGGAPPISTSGAVQLNGSVRTSQSSISGTSSLAVGTAMWTQLADATSAAFTVTLTATANKGYRFTIKKTDASANAVTVSAGAGTIDGSATYSLPTQYKYVTVESTGTSGVWYVVGNN